MRLRELTTEHTDKAHVAMSLGETWEHLTDGMYGVNVADDGRFYDDDGRVYDIDATVEAYLDQLAKEINRRGYKVSWKEGRRQAFDWQDRHDGLGFCGIEPNDQATSEDIHWAEQQLLDAIGVVFGAGAYWEYTGETIAEE